MTPSPWLKGPFTRPSNRAMGSPFDAPTSRPLSSQIAAIFAGGAPGLWAEADNAISTPWYQDSVGSTPVTAVEQTIGRAIDRSGRGNHLLQATAPARPLLSARVNLLAKTEDFADAIWVAVVIGAGTSAKTPNYSLAPDGTMTACRLLATAPGTSDIGSLRFGGQATGAVSHTQRCWIKSNTGLSQVITHNTGTGSAGLVTVPATGWVQIQFSTSVNTNDFALGLHRQEGTDAACDVSVWHPQLELGSVATRYQRVNIATDYDTAGFLHYDKFDGIDDGLSTAPFAAGTLTDNMDCFIALRRGSAAQSMLAYPTAGGASYLGAMDATAGAASNGAGTPTFWVNGVAVPGGTATTRTQLAAAIPVGSWAVVEIRNANLSAWTALGFGGYTSFPLNARVAAKLFCPAQSDAMRTTIRQYLAKKAGITL